MKKLLLIALLFTASYAINAQIETPQPSPFSKVEQKVGLTDVTIEYSRPGVKGRKIFGGLEQYGKVWRTGANKNTMITFSDDVVISGQTVKAGSYAIFTLVNENSWEVMFYNDTNNWGTPQKWDDSKVVATAKAEVIEIPFSIETLMIDINNIKNDAATLDIAWDNAYVSIPFTVPTDKTVSDAIAKTMNGPAASDYYAAAVYYLESGKDIKQAKTWMDKAMAMTPEPAFWQLRQQSLVYAKSGDKKEAVKVAKQSLELAEKAGNEAYVKMNKESLKEWGAM